MVFGFVGDLRKAANSVSEYPHRQHSTICNLPVLPEQACRPYFRDISACNMLIHLVRDKSFGPDSEIDDARAHA